MAGQLVCRSCDSEAVIESYYVYCFAHLKARYAAAQHNVKNYHCANLANGRGCVYDVYISEYSEGIDRRFRWLGPSNVSYTVDTSGWINLSDLCPACVNHQSKTARIDICESQLARAAHDVEVAKHAESEARKHFLTQQQRLDDLITGYRSVKRRYDILTSNYPPHGLKRKRSDTACPDEPPQKRICLEVEQGIDQKLREISAQTGTGSK